MCMYYYSQRSLVANVSSPHGRAFDLGVGVLKTKSGVIIIMEFNVYSHLPRKDDLIKARPPPAPTDIVRIGIGALINVHSHLPKKANCWLTFSTSRCTHSRRAQPSLLPTTSTPSSKARGCMWIWRRWCTRMSAGQAMAWRCCWSCSCRQ